MRNMSVRLRMFFSYSILLISALMVTVIGSQNMMHRVFRETVLQSYRRELVYIMNRLRIQLDHVKDYQKSIALDTVVMEILADNPQAPENELDFYNMNRTLRSRVIPIIGTNRYIYQYIFVTLDGTFLSFRDESFPALVEDVLGRDYFAVNNAERKLILDGPYEMNGVNGERLQFFVLSKQVVDLMTLDPLGYIAFIIEEDLFSDVFEKNLPYEMQVEFYLLSEKQQVLSSSDKETIGSDFMAGQNLTGDEVRQLQEEGSCEVTEGQDTLLYSLMKMEDSQWSVVYVTSMDTLLRSQGMVFHMTMTIGMIACVISLCIAFSIANRITEPIGALSKKMLNYHTMKRAGEDNTKFSSNEIQNLYYAFDQMLENSEKMTQQIYQYQEEKSNYQFQLIQSQIKPHFLYNTLEMIKSLVDCHMYEEAGEAVMAMSQFYRLSLNWGNDISSVAQEIELSRKYLYIQRLRYAEYMDYTIKECEGMEKYCIPKLTLQPLLENSIYHGIKEIQGMGKIELSISETEDSLIFLVWDNGAGISPEVLKKLRDSLKSTDKKKESSFGLYSINRRIQLFFGPEYGLEIESEQSVYTRIIMTIPKIKSNDFQKGVRGL